MQNRRSKVQTGACSQISLRAVNMAFKSVINSGLQGGKNNKSQSCWTAPTLEQFWLGSKNTLQTSFAMFCCHSSIFYLTHQAWQKLGKLHLNGLSVFNRSRAGIVTFSQTRNAATRPLHLPQHGAGIRGPESCIEKYVISCHISSTNKLSTNKLHLITS